MGTDNFHTELFKRIDTIRELKKVNKRQLCLLLNVSEAFFVKPRDISASTIVALKKAFPSLSYAWLLEGKGDIENHEVSEKGTGSFDKSFVNALLEIVDIQSKQIGIFVNGKEINIQDAYTQNLQKVIDILKKELTKSSPNAEAINQMLAIIKQQNDQLKEINERFKGLEEQLKRISD